MVAEQAALHAGGAAARRLAGEELHGRLERERRRVRLLGDRRIDLAVLDIRTEAPGLQHHLAAGRMGAEHLRRRGACGAEAPPREPALLGDDQVDRAVAADLQHVVVVAEIGVGLAVLNVGAVAPDAGEDRLLRFRVNCHLARQREKRHRLIERQIGRREALGQRRALRLFALAELDVGAEAAVAQRDLVARFGVGAQDLDARPVAVAADARLRRRRRACA